MSDLGPLFDPRPGLSHAAPAPAEEEAARRVAREAATLRRRVEAALRDAGARGLTVWELMCRIDAEEYSLRPRLTELGNEGMVRRSEWTRRNEKGNQTGVYVHRLHWLERHGQSYRDEDSTPPEKPVDPRRRHMSEELGKLVERYSRFLSGQDRFLLETVAKELVK